MKKTRFKIIPALAGILAAATLATGPALAASAPGVIKVGTLYAGSGQFAVSSQAQYDGLKFWVSRVNKDGGLFVKAYNKKIPVKLVAYDDQSSTATATTLYNQLITQDHVNVLVADFGSVLTSVAVPLAEEHHQLLIDVSGSSASFFTKKTDYLADVSIPSSGVWPIPLAGYLHKQGIKKVAVIYGSNDFDASQAATLKAQLSKNGVTPVYYHAVPTGETNYSVLLHSAAAVKPQAMIEFGYLTNDIAFLKQLKASGLHFPMVFTVFPGFFEALVQKDVGKDRLVYTYTYPTPPTIKYEKVNLGMNTDQFVAAWKTADNGTAPNFVNALGYNTGIVIGKMLGTAQQFTQISFHGALMDMSGKTRTVLGNFIVNRKGAQMGERLPVAQFQPHKDGSLRAVVVYPDKLATGKPVYPAPAR